MYSLVYYQLLIWKELYMPVYIKQFKQSDVSGHHARFWAKVDKSGDCWEWTAGKDVGGYGSFYLSGSSIKAHRIAYTITVGDIPDGMCVLHTCDNPPCVQPDHLFIGTYMDNYHDMKAKGRVYKGYRQHGESHTHAKLTEKDVIEIRASSDPQRAMARRFGVSDMAISKIKLRKSWKHI